MLNLALLAVLAQDIDLLRQAEDKAAAAKSLRWTGTAVIGADRKEFTVSLDAAFKEGGRGRLSALPKEGEAPSFCFTSDGRRLLLESSKRESQSGDVDAAFAPALNRILVRGGIFAINQLRPGTTGEKLLEDVKAVELTVSDDPVGERAAKRLLYTLNVGGKKAAVKLWIDPATLAPLRRELAGEKEPRITETYLTWQPEADIPDDLFKAASK